MLGTSEKGLCIRTGCAHVKVTPLSFCAVIVFFFSFSLLQKKSLNLFVTVKQTSLCQRGFSLEKLDDWLQWQ